MATAIPNNNVSRALHAIFISFILVVEIGSSLTFFGSIYFIPITVYDEHHKQDVLSGRGYVIDKHHGNHQFRSMVDAQRPKFGQIKRKGKRAVALKIMQDISSLEPPGRFLVESKGVAPSTNSVNDSNDNDGGVHPSILSKKWVIVDHEKVMQKVLHRLRDKDPGGEDGLEK